MEVCCDTFQSDTVTVMAISIVEIGRVICKKSMAFQRPMWRPCRKWSYTSVFCFSLDSPFTFLVLLPLRIPPPPSTTRTRDTTQESNASPPLSATFSALTPHHIDFNMFQDASTQPLFLHLLHISQSSPWWTFTLHFPAWLPTISSVLWAHCLFSPRPLPTCKC